MSERRFPHTCAGRVSSRELARVDAAARLRGLNRATYVRDAVLAAAARDLQAEALAERETDDARAD